MSKNSSDQFSKQFLEEVLTPLGNVEISHEVLGEAQLVDVYFVPSPQPSVDPTSLGLLGRISQHPCLIEPFRNQPTATEIRSCLLKLFQVQGDRQRQARRESKALLEVNLPQLWIFAPSASERLLQTFGAIGSESWPAGVYFLAPSLRTAIVAIDRLPRTEESLWLRLLGKGRTQKGAIAEVLAFETDDPRRSSIMRLLANWKISIEVTGQIEAEQELMMVLSQAYLEWERQTEQRGRQEGRQEGECSLVLRQLTRRIGNIAPDLRAKIQSLSLPQLEALGEALLDFSHPDNLVEWLRLHS
ncbi:DUF4351 domain-containing protein [Altericista sp. CCNU0014]|uniref:DUF4351 domain-containing protein n=1 Tax=Altericista sp. CCNU0014 TaxID=3082949 RepID=UPI00384D8873